MRTGTLPSTNRGQRFWPALLLVVTATVLLLASIAPAAAQQSTGSAEATVPPIDDVTGDRLKDIFGSDTPANDVTTPESVAGSFTSDEFGFTVSYATPWSYSGWWTLDGLTTHYLALEGTQAGMYVAGWEWPGDATVRDYVAWWADPVYIEEWIPGAEALRFTATDTVGAVVHISTPTDEYPEPWIYVTELHLAGSYAIEIIFFAPISEFSAAYGTNVEDMTIDNAPLLTVFALNEIEEMLPVDTVDNF